MHYHIKYITCSIGQVQQLDNMAYVTFLDFTCALQKEILYQGKLFISENWICFFSKVFGKDIKVCKGVSSMLHSVTQA